MNLIKHLKKYEESKESRESKESALKGILIAMIISIPLDIIVLYCLWSWLK